MVHGAGSGRGRSAVALLSGGLDSAVALAEWLEQGDRAVAALTLDYGQRAAGPEARAGEALAGRLGVPWRRVAVPFLAEAATRAGSALVGGDRELPVGTAARPGDEASAAAVWVPARNVVLIALAAAWAEAVGAERVLVGFNREEAVTFPDNSLDFVGAMDALLGLGTRSGVAVASPTLLWDKVDIAARARARGLSPGDVWSCYGAGPDPCGRCESCARSARAWAAADERNG